MARSDRLLRLLQALRSLPGPVTAIRLAEETEVSVRTIYRDIDSLRSAGATIEGATGFGYRLVEDMALPPQMFSRIEIEALVLGLEEVKHLGDAELARAAEAVFAKITAMLPERMQLHAVHAVNGIYKPATLPAPTLDMSMLRSACWQEEVLAIRYTDEKGRTSERDIWPLSILYLDTALILIAKCCSRHAFRRFRVDRITDCRPTGRSFRPHRVALLREFISEARSERRQRPDDVEPRRH